MIKYQLRDILTNKVIQEGKHITLIRKALEFELEQIYGFFVPLGSYIFYDGKPGVYLSKRAEALLTDDQKNLLAKDGISREDRQLTWFSIRAMLAMYIEPIHENSNENQEEITMAAKKGKVYTEGLNVIMTGIQNDAVANMIEGACGQGSIGKIKAFVDIAKDNIPTETQLDKPLLQEIGKAYRMQYDAYKASGDEDKAKITHGAMLAIKRIMDMMSQ